MNDIELLELAAKAAGLPWDQWVVDGNDSWNPLTDDSDALRLAIALGLRIEPYPLYEIEKHSVVVRRRSKIDLIDPATDMTEVVELYAVDAGAATRRAIVRCAAEI